MAGLLTSDKGPTGETRLSDWLQSKGEAIGQQYLGELWRNYLR